MVKYIHFILILITLANLPLKAQFVESDERRKMWRKSARHKKFGKKSEAFNPYLDKKAKDKPSAKLNSQNTKAVRKMNKIAKKQTRSSKRKIKNKANKFIKG